MLSDLFLLLPFWRSHSGTGESSWCIYPLLLHDLGVDNPANPSVISMLIKKSKTDQGQREAKINIGKTGNSLCPIAAMEVYLWVRGSSSGLLFQWESRFPLSKSSFVKCVRAVLEEAGLPAIDYAGHSFRTGTTTTAAVAGLEDSAIQTLGWWESSVFKDICDLILENQPSCHIWYFAKYRF